MEEKPRLVVNPTVCWAVEPEHASRIEFIPHLASGALPFVGQVVTRACMVDPVTLRPCPVRVTRIEHLTQNGHTVIAPVVARAD